MPMVSYWRHSYPIILGVIVSLEVITITGGKRTGLSSHIPKENPCPDPEEVKPCVCYYDEYEGMDIVCYADTKEDDLPAVFSKDGDFPSTNFSRLVIQNNIQIKSLREGYLGNSSFREIYLDCCAITEIDDTALAGSRDTLTLLDLSGNLLETVPDLSIFTKLDQLYVYGNKLNQFPSLISESLTYLDVDNNNLNKVPVDAFKALPSLEKLYLYGCELTEISSGTFTANEHLWYLDLGDNNLTTLPEDAVKLYGDKSILLLNRNEITYLPDVAITGVTGELDMSFNSMTELPENIFKPLLEENVDVHLWGNPFDCDCDIAWLVLNQTLRERVPSGVQPPACSDGMAFEDLEPKYYEVMCDNVTLA